MKKNSQILLGQSHFIRGYWGSMFQPVWILNVTCSKETIPEDRLLQLNEFRRSFLGDSVSDNLLIGNAFKNQLMRYLTLITLDILSLVKMPIMSGARAVKTKNDTFSLGLPGVSELITTPVDALNFAIKILNQLLGDKDLNTDELIQALNKMVSFNQRLSPVGINTERFLVAAHNLKIPWIHVINNVYQFGWGKNSRLLDSSFTDRTSNIGSRLARHKYSCARALSLAGIPTPDQYLVNSENEVKLVADMLDFPLVIKPENLDGGRGVVVGIDNLKDLLSFYREIRKISHAVLIEKYIQGQDYRLQVFQDRVFWVALRRPAKVIGDGESTVGMLIEEVNFLRKRNNSFKKSTDQQSIQMHEFGAENIIFDKESNLWLKKQHLTLDSIPALGQEVRLKGAANFSQGGTRQGIELNEVHKDNIDLAVKAVKTLRLDLAGVDMLIPDISRSYKEVGGVICEVNAQPQLSSHLPQQLIKELVKNSGRIPVMIMYGVDLDRRQKAEINFQLNAKGIRVGWADKFIECQRFLSDPEIGLIIWSPSSLLGHHSFWPVDMIDILITTYSIIEKLKDSQLSLKSWPSLLDRARKVVPVDKSNSSIEKVVIQELTSCLNENTEN